MKIPPPLFPSSLDRRERRAEEEEEYVCRSFLPRQIGDEGGTQPVQLFFQCPHGTKLPENICPNKYSSQHVGRNSSPVFKIALLVSVEVIGQECNASALPLKERTLEYHSHIVSPTYKKSSATALSFPFYGGPLIRSFLFFFSFLLIIRSYGRRKEGNLTAFYSS